MLLCIIEFARIVYALNNRNKDIGLFIKKVLRLGNWLDMV
jgi:hypothetical protein